MAYFSVGTHFSVIDIKDKLTNYLGATVFLILGFVMIFLLEKTLNSIKKTDSGFGQ